MLNVFADHTWTFVALLVAIAAVLMFRFWQTRQAKWLAGAVVSLLLIAAVFLVDRFIQSPAEQVTNLLHQLADAARKQDAEFIVQAISDDYEHEGKSKSQIASLVRGRLSDYQAQSVQLNGVEVRADGDIASAKFVAITSGTIYGHAVNRYAVRLRLEFKSWRTNGKSSPSTGMRFWGMPAKRSRWSECERPDLHTVSRDCSLEAPANSGHDD